MTTAAERFLAAGPFAVVGASRDRRKFGNKVLRCYRDRGLPVAGVHPAESEIEGVACYPSLAAVPERPGAVSFVTPPPITAQAMAEALELGIRHLWMQPGAESDAAIAAARAAGANVLAYGPCLLIELGWSE